MVNWKQLLVQGNGSQDWKISDYTKSLDELMKLA